MSWLSKLFDKSTHSPEDDPEYSAAISRAEKALTGLPETEARRLACVALLLARVAHADLEISESEKTKMREVLVAQLKLSPVQAAAVCAVAVESALASATDLHIVLKRTNELADKEFKARVIRAMFHVATVDDISAEENAEISNVASGLFLSRSEFVALRSEFREWISVLKGLPSS